MTTTQSNQITKGITANKEMNQKQKELIQTLNNIVDNKESSKLEKIESITNTLYDSLSQQYNYILDLNTNFTNIVNYCKDKGMTNIIDTMARLQTVDTYTAPKQMEEYQEVVDLSGFVGYNDLNKAIVKVAKDIRTNLLNVGYGVTLEQLQKKIIGLEFNISQAKKITFVEQSLTGHKSAGSLFKAMSENANIENLKESNEKAITMATLQIDEIKAKIKDYEDVTPMLEFMNKMEYAIKNCENVKGGLVNDKDMLSKTKNGCIRILTALESNDYFTNDNSLRNDVIDFINLDYKDQVNNTKSIDLFLEFARGSEFARCKIWHDTLKCNIKDSKTM